MTLNWSQAKVKYKWRTEQLTAIRIHDRWRPPSVKWWWSCPEAKLFTKVAPPREKLSFLPVFFFSFDLCPQLRRRAWWSSFSKTLRNLMQNPETVVKYFTLQATIITFARFWLGKNSCRMKRGEGEKKGQKSENRWPIFHKQCRNKSEK